MIQLHNISNILKRVIKYFLLSTLFFTFSYSNQTTFSYVDKIKLYENSYWLKLLHYKNGLSEIDSSNFFISKEGKINPKKELFETITALKTGKKDVLCRFPLRVLWLKQNIPNFQDEIKTYPCKELEEYVGLMDGKFVSLVFPTAHINSPASMYGHTFLKISSNEDTALISNAINFAAHTEDTNGIIFAYKGLFGEYEGRYSILPYYKKIKEYNDLEQRDIWEYELDLTKEEINRLVLHSFELKDTYSDYYFFNENCSYSILWLLEIARSDLDLVNKFHFKTVPLDSIKVLKPYNLIKESKYRYSSMKKLKFILSKKIKNDSYLKSFVNEDKPLNENLTMEDKVAYLDFKIAYIQYLRRNNKIDKKEYLTKYLALLKERSSYAIVSTYEIDKPFNPLNSHDSGRMALFHNSRNVTNFSIKPVYNDIYDISDGYLEGAYIDFFDTNIKIEENNSKLDRFTLLKIKSLAPQDMFFKPISWGIDFGYEHFKEESAYMKLRPEFGVTFETENELFYSMLNSNLFYKSNNQLYSIGNSIGIISNRFENLKLGMQYSYNQYNKSIENKEFEAFFTYKINDKLSLNSKYSNDNLYKDEEDSLEVGILYYF